MIKQKQQAPCIGVIGGMGPEATCDLFAKILANCEAKSDQEYPRILIDCNSNIPGRTKAILGGTNEPLHEMLRSALWLEAGGADFIVMPCNTAHYFLPEMLPFLHKPFLSIVDSSVAKLQADGVKAVLVLATTGTIQVGLYQEALKAAGITPVLPDAAEQDFVMTLIDDHIKAGDYHIDKVRLQAILDRYAATTDGKVLLACTELPLLFERVSGLVIDKLYGSTDILAETAARYAKDLWKAREN